MNPPMKLLMPLRVPELAPSLGRIIVPRRLFDPWVPVDDIREELATRVLELGGEGRAAAAREGDGQARARVLEVTGRRAWAAAWDHAVRRAGARVADALDAEITRTTRQVRMPRRRMRRHLLSNAEKRAIVARLGTGGGTFVAALDDLEPAAWRPSLWPVIIGWLPLGVLLLWLGLILSGYVPAPAWLAAQLGF